VSLDDLYCLPISGGACPRTVAVVRACVSGALAALPGCAFAFEMERLTISGSSFSGDFLLWGVTGLKRSDIDGSRRALSLLLWSLGPTLSLL
jgi:hypothetical protein